MKRQLFTILATITICVSAPTSAQDSQPAELQKLMVFRSFLQDHAQCELTFKDDKASPANLVENMTPNLCPDTYAWLSFTKAISGEFWKWARNDTIWIETPREACKELTYGIGEADCPFLPEPGNEGFSINPAARNALPDHGRASSIAALDTGRFLRDHQLELVFRDNAMTDYIRDRALYSTNGLGDVFRKQSNALASGDIAEFHELQVDFPIGSLMFKTSLIAQEQMEELDLIQDIGYGLPPNDPDAPFITTEVGLTPSPRNPDMKRKRTYYLVSMTVASKSSPNWHWFAMDHVKLPGRCDYTGCNDSFGLYGLDTTSSLDFGANEENASALFGPYFVAPHMMPAGDGTRDLIFSTGRQYSSDTDFERSASPKLKKLFSEMGIGDADPESGTDLFKLGIANSAWKNYRLKGSQTDFTSATGIPTGVGSSVTEGGFVTSSSCMSCHAQAAVNLRGKHATPIGATWEPNMMGITRTVMGTPSSDLFYEFGDLKIRAATSDFVWGILNAYCIPVRENGRVQRDAEGKPVCLQE